MSSAGAPYSRTVTTTAQIDEATQILVTSMAGTRYAIAVPQPGTIVATRTYRPTWAIVLTCCTAWLFLTGLLFLLITRSEAVTLRIARQGSRTQVIVAGTADYEMVTRVNAGLRTLPSLADAHGQPVEIKDPVVMQGANLMQGVAKASANVDTATAIASPPTPERPSSVSDPLSIGYACHNCGQTINHGERFCRECGAAQPQPCENCGTPRDPADRFCTGCGTPVGGQD